MTVASARVIECYGRRVVVALEDGHKQSAEIFGKRLRVVCGDEVTVTTDPSSGALQVIETQPRKTHFTRTNAQGRPEVLAANMTQLVILMSGQPTSDPFIIDRYLAGAELGGIKSLLLITKQDLGHSEELQRHVTVYQQAGYEVLYVSALQPESLITLKDSLRNHVSMLVGESGVGKSTLTNALLGGVIQRIREISDATGEGRHTTVSSILFDLPEIQAALMDSPGVRDYAPAPVNDLQVAFGWREISRYSGQCKFNNCLHFREPGCAIHSAVAAGEIDQRRYDSYKRLLNLMRQLLPSYERH